MYASKSTAKSSSKQGDKQVIQLVLQAAENGNRRDVPGTWTPHSKLTDIMVTMELELVGVSLEHATMRYLQKIVPQSEWSTTSLKHMGLKEGGRALLTLKLNAGGTASSTEDVEGATGTSVASSPQLASVIEGSTIESSITTLLNSSFDADTKVCIVTLLKVLDNILQKPQNPKVRSIRLANASFAKKVVERKGAVNFLIACGFQLQAAPPSLLSSDRMDLGEECLVLVKEDTAHLVKARRLLMTKAIQDLNMRADDLPKYKPTPQLTAAGDHAAGRTPTTSGGEFDPYKGHRYDAMAAAVGKSIGPDENYVSPTEQQLNALQSQQKKLESSLHSKPLLDREICASLPNSAPTSNSAVAASGTSGATNTKSDGSLVATQFARQQQERRSKEQQGFTTKAMRDLELLKKRKVYSHAQLRIQFPDGTVLEAKFLPKERFSVVKKVLREECFMESTYDFDLYVSPPRRKLDEKKTLEAEGLVPAAKVFLSWKSDAYPPKSAPIGTFLKSSLFREDAKPAYPSARALVDGDEISHSEEQPPTAKKTKSDKLSGEDEMIARMMGKGGGLGGGSKKDKSVGKPKWFKG